MIRPVMNRLLNILAVLRTVGDLIDALGMPLIAAGQLTEDAISPDGDTIDQPPKDIASVMLALLDDILLDHHVIAVEAPALPLARDLTDPCPA